MGEGLTCGVSLRSTKGPTLGWVVVVIEPDWASGLFFGEDVLGGAAAGAAGPEALVQSLEGLLCAVLKLSETELVAAEGSRVTTVEVVSTAAGLFDGGEGERDQTWELEGASGKEDTSKKT